MSVEHSCPLRHSGLQNRLLVADVPFDQLLKRRQALLKKALTRSPDPKQVLRLFHLPTLLGLSGLDLSPGQVTLTTDREQFADLCWEETDLALAFENPIDLLTQALVGFLHLVLVS